MNFNTCARFNRAGTFNIATDHLPYTTLLDLDTLDLKSITISHGVLDVYPRAELRIFGEYTLDTAEDVAAYYVTDDHLGVDQDLFTGVLLGSTVEYDPGDDTTSVSGAGFGYYQAMQYVPEQFLHNYASINPAVTVFGLTGGDEWAGMGGIEPYRIMPVSAWGTTLNTRVFDFDRTTEIKTALQKICDYTRHVYLIQSALDAYNRPTARAYFVHEDDLDTYMDIPAATTITNPNGQLQGGFSMVYKGDEAFNTIIVMGRDSSGNPLSAVAATPDAIQGNKAPRVKIERSGAFTTQAQVQARVTELYGLYATPAEIFTGTFLDRMDLRILQKIKMSGYTNVSSDWNRITNIRYIIEATNDGIKKQAEIQFTSDAKFTNMRRMYRSMEPDPLGEVEALFDAKVGQMPIDQAGTLITDNGDGTGEVLLEDGTTVTTRI